MRKCYTWTWLCWRGGNRAVCRTIVIGRKDVNLACVPMLQSIPDSSTSRASCACCMIVLVSLSSFRRFASPSAGRAVNVSTVAGRQLNEPDRNASHCLFFWFFVTPQSKWCDFECCVVHVFFVMNRYSWKQCTSAFAITCFTVWKSITAYVLVIEMKSMIRVPCNIIVR